VTETWTLPELVAEAATRLEALPAPKNGQVRAVPDERTIRYYGTIGLLDRPASMRGRTALYNRRHLAQVVAIKRMQGAGRSLAEIQALWPTLDDTTLARMSGVHVGAAATTTTTKAKAAARKEFWKRDAEPEPQRYPLPVPAAGWPSRTGISVEPPPPESPLPEPQLPPQRLAPPNPPATTLTIPLAAGAAITIAVGDDGALSLSPADVRALRAAAAPLVTELARRGLIAPPGGTLEEEP
jgi:DNA-binding transcriptional MerR regulator